MAVVTTINQWNTYRIQAKNNEIKVWINDTLTIETKDKALSDGYIGLQAKGTGHVKFRNVKLKPLTED